MHLSSVLVVLVVFLWSADATSDNLTNAVIWDSNSLIVNGQRLYVYSGEFHYQRMPVPEMWLDIFQKFRANGFNAISVYFFWSYHSASKGVYDFETSGKNVQRMLDYAQEAGLYVIARPGPYVNAETNGGGFALWGSDGSMGNLRTSDKTYQQSWEPWVTEIGKILAANEIAQGGPVILSQVENELQETVHSPTNTLVLYMEQLESAFRAAGITVPFTHNEKGQRSQSWSTDYEDVGGAVNVYGLDSYPGGLSCTNINTGFNVVRNYFQWFSNYSFTQPSYLAEFEGGYFTPWGGQFYDDCLAEHDPAFADIFYKNNIGQIVTLQNLYMAWGGTNWGHSAAPVVYTSYDYSAPLRETRQIWDKMYQIKLMGFFTRVSTDLLTTYMAGNGTGFRVSSANIWVWLLANHHNNAGFTVLQHAVSSSRAYDTFTAYIKTTGGTFAVPNVILDGRQSKIIVNDYNFGSHALLYSTAEVLTYGVFDVDVLVFYLREGQTGQFAFKNPPAGLTYKTYGSTSIKVIDTNGTQSYVYTQGTGQTTIKFSDGTLIYLLDLPSAWQFWAPTTVTTPIVLPDQQIFVLGPYLVRNASISHGVVHIFGDSNKTSTIEVYTGDSSVTTIDWNGIYLAATKTPYGSITARIPGTESRSVSLPTLTGWKSGNSLPELLLGYNDSHWTVCDKTSSLSPIAPMTLPVLFSSDYGFYTGAKIYRGYFDGTSANSVVLTTSGGFAFGFNVWLNGKLIGGAQGDPTLSTITTTLSFAGATLKSSGNVLVVVVDYHGHDETSTGKGIENPRGILGATLSSGTFSTWKIQGNAGGGANIDPVRGPMNEGGLYGERQGWHLPGFNVSKLPSTSSPMDGLSSSGIQFYVTNFNLDIDMDLDAPLGIELSAPAGTVARVMIWVNGYQYGKYIPHIGPQTRFPIPPGVINNRGANTLALSLWAQTDAGAKLADVQLFTYGLYQSAFGFAGDWSYLQPAWNSRREDVAYA